jgi:alpha-tubulin suppressor-like RCC1 family protein
MIPANPDPIEPGDGGPDNHAPGQSWSGGPAASVAADWQQSCEVRLDHSIACWGRGTSAFDAMACAGSAECGQAHAPAGAFSQVSMGTYHSCALGLDGTVICFGAGATDQNCVNHECGQSIAPSGSFTDVSAGDQHSCAVAADATIVCWGAGKTDSACTIDQCGQANPPAGAFSKVAAGYHHSCALALDGTVQCWGDPSEVVEPQGVFTELIAGSFGNCGIREGGSLECWGPGGILGPPAPPTGAFSGAALSINWGCGIQKPSGTLQCWGQDMGGNLNAPSGSFRQVAVGDAHGCAVRADDTVVCWGADEVLEAQPPP